MTRAILLPFLHYKFLLTQLIQREIKARYKQSILGYAWVIINPLLQMLVFTFVFSVIFRFNTTPIPYPVFLLAGPLPWIYFQHSISSAANCLVDNSDLLRKVYFPREVFIYAVICAKAIDLFFAFIIFLVLEAFYGIPVDLSIFLLIPILFIQILLMTGIGLLLSMFNLFYRDIQYLTNLLLMLWMYLTPIIYPLSFVPEKYLFIYNLNPMVGIIEGYRSIFFHKPINMDLLATSAIVSFTLFGLSYVVFKRNEKIFSDIV